MIPRLITAVTGLVGLALFAAFIIGLSHSISTGFAGFWGGFPFAVIVTVVLILAAYDTWEECLRKKRS